MHGPTSSSGPAPNPTQPNLSTFPGTILLLDYPVHYQTYIVKVLENWCESPAGRTPMSREVEEDHLLVGQGHVSGNGRAVGTVQTFSRQKIHD